MKYYLYKIQGHKTNNILNYRLDLALDLNSFIKNFYNHMFEEDKNKLIELINKYLLDDEGKEFVIDEDFNILKYLPIIFFEAIKQKEDDAKLIYNRVKKLSPDVTDRIFDNFLQEITSLINKDIDPKSLKNLFLDFFTHNDNKNLTYINDKINEFSGVKKSHFGPKNTSNSSSDTPPPDHHGKSLKRTHSVMSIQNPDDLKKPEVKFVEEVVRFIDNLENMSDEARIASGEEITKLSEQISNKHSADDVIYLINSSSKTTKNLDNFSKSLNQFIQSNISDMSERVAMFNKVNSATNEHAPKKSPKSLNIAESLASTASFYSKP